MESLNWALVLIESYTPADGGRAYTSERVVVRYEGKRAAEVTAEQLNMKALEGQYYSIRQVKITD